MTDKEREFVAQANALVSVLKKPEKVAAALGLSLNALHLRMNRAGVRWEETGCWVAKESGEAHGDRSRSAVPA